MRTVYIVGAADFAPARFAPAEGDAVIAADAGILHLERLGVKPDLVLGDFDSLGRVPELPDVEVSPVRKDDTDSMLAARRALDIGGERLMFFGCLGGKRSTTRLRISRPSPGAPGAARRPISSARAAASWRCPAAARSASIGAIAATSPSSASARTPRASRSAG